MRTLALFVAVAVSVMGCAGQPLRQDRLDPKAKNGDLAYAKRNTVFSSYIYKENASGLVQAHAEVKNFGDRNLLLLAKCEWRLGGDVSNAETFTIVVPPRATRGLMRKVPAGGYGRQWKCRYYHAHAGMIGGTSKLLK